LSLFFSLRSVVEHNRPTSEEVSGLLRAAGRDATERLLPLVYDELHRIAQGLMRKENQAITLQPTALVNEACMRLLAAKEVSWNDRAHFLAIGAQAMRQILISHARARNADKRKPKGERVTLAEVAATTHEAELTELHDALETLERVNPMHARLVELRFLGGLETREIAHVMDMSEATVKREWRVARAWLAATLRLGANGESAAET